MKKYIKKPREEYLTKGYKPAKTKAWRKPTDAEPQLMQSIVEFTQKIDFSNKDFNWGKGTRGPKPSDPMLLLRVWIFGYLKAISSAPKLYIELKQNRDLQYLSGGFLFSPTTLNLFRREFFGLIEEVYKNISEWHGKPEGDGYVDGAQFEGASSKYEFRKSENLEKNQEKYLKKAEEGDIEAQKRVELYQKAIEYRDEHPDVTSLNLQDLSMRVIRHGNRVTYGYNVLFLCDDRQRIYYAKAFDSAREFPHVIEFLKDYQKYIGYSTSYIVMDKDFYNANVIEEIKILGSKAVVASRKSNIEEKRAKKGLYTRDKYIFDQNNNNFVCPNNKILKYLGLRTKDRRYKPVHLYSTSCEDCRGCPMRDKCLPSEKSKKKELVVNQSEKLLFEHNAWMETKKAQELLRKRCHKIEPAIGKVKDEKTLNFKRFHLKGLENTQIELMFLLIAVAVKMGRSSPKIFFCLFLELGKMYIYLLKDKSIKTNMVS